MFAGIVEHVGRLTANDPTSGGRRLWIEAGELLQGMAHSHSIAVNGACLTVEEISGDQFAATIVPETIRRTNLGELRPGDGANLERPLRPEGFVGGHFVQGHVDAVERVLERREQGEEVKLRVSLRQELERYVAPKGYIAVDGTSLTVVEVEPGWFSFVLVPYTMEHSTIGRAKEGTRVNIEVDILAKYIERILQAQSQQE